MYDKRPKSKTVVRFQDCDVFGHLNNARYIDYFINAREDHLRRYYAFDLYGYGREKGANWLVTKHEIVYLRPALLGEAITIQTGLLSFSGDSLLVEGVMLDEGEGQVKAVQWTTFRHVDLQSGRSSPHPLEVGTLLEEVVLQGEVSREDLNQRVRQLKRERAAQPVGQM